MTSMRARTYNKFAGSVDAIGAVPTYAIAQKAISFALDKRNQRRLVSRDGNQSYEVAGISEIGLAYIFVRDKKINTIEKIKGKKFAVLGYDEAQKIVVRSLGGQAVLSDISDIAKKFNSGQADIMAAPAYAYKSLELYKISKVLGVPMEWLMGGDEPICDNIDDYWHQEVIRLQAQLDMAISTLEGTLQSLKSKRR